LRTRVIANITKLNKLGAIAPSVFNFLVKNKVTSGLMKKLLGFAPKRTIPLLYHTTLHNWQKKALKRSNSELPFSEKFPNGKVCLFADEFTEYNDTAIGICTIKLLNRLGYDVVLPRHVESGRTYLSKGLLLKAQKLANKNIEMLQEVISDNIPLIGIEPSGILSFRDEYRELVRDDLKEAADKLARNSYMIDEFIVMEMKKGRINRELFTKEKQLIKLHGHCHQKALASTGPTKEMLTIPENYQVEEIKSGCCGMAGAFGYEKEHYDVSIKVGKLVLFPEIIKSDNSTIISAPGTSCRHQIKDGTGRVALHPVEVLFEAMIETNRIY